MIKKNNPDFLILIIVLIALVIFPVYYYFVANRKYFQNAKKLKTKTDMEQLLSGLEGWKKEYGNFPFKSFSHLSSEEKKIFFKMLKGNSKLILNDKRNSKGIKFIKPSSFNINDGSVLDSWGSPFIFKFNTENIKFEVKSFGPNKTDDDGKGDDMIGQRKIF